MAESFKNALLSATSTEQTLYTCPASTTTVVISIQCANVSGIDSTITALVDDEGSTEYYIAKDLTIPANSAVDIVAGKLILDASDAIRIISADDDYIHVVGSILEIT